MIGFALVRIIPTIQMVDIHLDIRLFATRRLRDKAHDLWGKRAGWEVQDIPIEDEV